MKKIIQLFEDLNVNVFSFLLVITDDSELKITHDMEYSGLVDITVLSLVSKIITKKKSKDCSSGRAVLVDNKGDTYPCQMFYNSEKYNLGNVLSDDIEKINIRGLEVHNLNRFHVNECKNCIAKNICYSWCRGLNYLKNGEILSTIYEKCLQQRILLEETLVGLAKIKEHKDNAKIFVENYNKIIKKWKNG